MKDYNEQYDVVENMTFEFGHGTTMSDVPMYEGEFYDFYMIVGTVNQNGYSVYYEGSDDLDELYEQAATILNDNAYDGSTFFVMATPIAIVNTLTRRMYEPMLPAMVQFRETTGIFF